MAIAVKAVTISVIALATPSALHRQRKDDPFGLVAQHRKASNWLCNDVKLDGTFVFVSAQLMDAGDSTPGQWPQNHQLADCRFSLAAFGKFRRELRKRLLRQVGTAGAQGLWKGDQPL